MLEVIHQHAYHKSRFLRGACVDEAQIVPANVPEAQADAAPVRFLHPERLRVHWLDKAISFDDAQQAVYLHAAPMIIVGSTGSGKTALTLEKLKQIPGDVLYVTQSAYLAQSARDLYYADGFEREGQEATFLSFREFVESIKVPTGREATWRDFSAWLGRMRQQFKQVDAHHAYEEIRGVLAADASGALTRKQYLGLGARQSIFAADQRPSLYELFDKYCLWLRESGLYDLNLIAHDWMPYAAARYDFIVVDEVQDLTVVQLRAVPLRPGPFSTKRGCATGSPRSTSSKPQATNRKASCTTMRPATTGHCWPRYLPTKSALSKPETLSGSPQRMNGAPICPISRAISKISWRSATSMATNTAPP